MSLERWLMTARLRLRSLFRRGRVEDDLADEMQFHLEERTRQFLSQGLSERDARRVGFVEDCVKDLGYGIRLLARSPGFGAVAIFSLALGIGANTAMFSVVDALVLKKLPVRDPDSLVTIEIAETYSVAASHNWPIPDSSTCEGCRRVLLASLRSGRSSARIFRSMKLPAPALIRMQASCASRSCRAIASQHSESER